MTGRKAPQNTPPRSQVNPLLTPRQRRILGVLAGAVALTGVVALAGVVRRGPQPAPPTISVTTTSSASTVAPNTTGDTTSVPATPPSTVDTTVGPTSTTEPSGGSASPDLIVLRPDGLGVVPFGASPELTISKLTGLLGPVTDDTGWMPASGPYATCLGPDLRFVRWASLQVFFTDGPSDWSPGGPHFAAYALSPTLGEPVLDLRTNRGIGIGTPVGDVRAVYGSDSVSDDPLAGPMFLVDFGDQGFLFGFLSGTEPDDIVTAIGAGRSCAE